MSSGDDIQKDLSSESSLLAVYQKSRSFSESRFDFFVRLSSFAILVVLSIMVVFAKNDLYPILGKAVLSWVNLGFVYATAILGFLVAGFTIFSTMTRTEIFIGLARINHDIGISQIKFIFYSFLRVFIVHIFLIFTCVFIIMLHDTSNIYLSFIKNEYIEIEFKKISVIFLMPLVGYLTISSLLYLKTFVWNLYQSIIIAISGAAAVDELKKIQHK